jgi:hypothetical protein
VLFECHCHLVTSVVVAPLLAHRKGKGLRSSTPAAERDEQIAMT